MGTHRRLDDHGLASRMKSRSAVCNARSLSAPCPPASCDEASALLLHVAGGALQPHLPSDSVPAERPEKKEDETQCADVNARLDERQPGGHPHSDQVPEVNFSARAKPQMALPFRHQVATVAAGYRCQIGAEFRYVVIFPVPNGHVGLYPI